MPYIKEQLESTQLFIVPPAIDPLSPKNVELPEETCQAILERYGVRQATELILCCSYFNMLSRFLESTRVELETEDLIGDRTPEKIAPSE